MRDGLGKSTTGIKVLMVDESFCLITSSIPEFDVIDSNGGGQILFGEFIQWAISKDLDIAVDKD